MLAIGDAAKYLHISIDTLRRWEKKGLAKAHRSKGGHRMFKKSDLDQLFGKRYKHEKIVAAVNSVNPTGTIATETSKSSQPFSYPSQNTSHHSEEISWANLAHHSAPPPHPMPPELQSQPQENSTHSEQQIQQSQLSVSIPTQLPSNITTTNTPLEISPPNNEEISKENNTNQEEELSTFQKFLLASFIAFLIIDLILLFLWQYTHHLSPV